MKEITDDKESAPAEAPLSAADLAGVPPILHEMFQAIAEASPDSVHNELAAARRVCANKDGSVGIELTAPITFDGDRHEGVRLRALKAGDYFTGAAELASDTSMVGSMRFAQHLMKPAGGILQELACEADMLAVYFAVWVLRKNFSRPRT